MSEAAPNTNRPRWRPRVSLLTALLLIALAACGITIWQLWHEVEPLRAQVRTMRTELGQLNIDDPNVAQAIQVGTREFDHWKWRVYLPPGGKYQFLAYFGTKVPPPNGGKDQAWFDAVQKSSGGMYSSYPDGESVVDIQLVKKGDTWQLVTGGSNGQSLGAMSIDGDWLSQKFGRNMTSSTASDKQSSFQPGQPILLMSIFEPVVTRSGTSTSRTGPTKPTNGIVVWIEQKSTVPPNATVAPK